MSYNLGVWTQISWLGIWWANKADNTVAHGRAYVSLLNVQSEQRKVSIASDTAAMMIVLELPFYRAIEYKVWLALCSTDMLLPRRLN